MLKLNGVRQEILLKQRQIEELEKDHVLVDADVTRKNTQLTRFLKFMNNYTVGIGYFRQIDNSVTLYTSLFPQAPDVLDFVKLQREIDQRVEENPQTDD